MEEAYEVVSSPSMEVVMQNIHSLLSGMWWRRFRHLGEGWRRWSEAPFHIKSLSFSNGKRFASRAEIKGKDNFVPFSSSCLFGLDLLIFF